MELWLLSAVKRIDYELFLYTKSPEDGPIQVWRSSYNKNQITRSRRDDSYLVHLAYG